MTVLLAALPLYAEAALLAEYGAAVLRRVWGRLRCRLGRHRWTVTTAAEQGIAVGIPHCTRCPKVDVHSIVSTVWNRSERRRVRRRGVKVPRR